MTGMAAEIRSLAVAIDRPAAEVCAFVREPRNLPAWAAGLAGGIEQVDGHWYAASPMGRVEVSFVSDEPGVLDHDVVLPSGETVRNRLRVRPQGTGSEAVFTLHRQPGMTDDEFAADAAAVTADLHTLRDLLQRG
jgi:hypothetical protein